MQEGWRMASECARKAAKCGKGVRVPEEVECVGMTHSAGRGGGGLLRPLSHSQLGARGRRGTTTGTAKGHVASLSP